jgi:5-aminolevulinate synthase
MGPALNVRSKEIAAGYASFAGNGFADVAKIHQDQGVEVPAGATVEMCPHASAARLAARKADELASAGKKKAKGAAEATSAKEESVKAAAAGCPFHKAALAETSASAAAENKPTSSAPASKLFDYESFYNNELEKKHQDKSYRYFNNINRLAGKFPVAHTSDVQDEVQVWCSNDYLGMGNNPVVIETMQCVFSSVFV